jgi:hypothetical protein
MPAIRRFLPFLLLGALAAGFAYYAITRNPYRNVPLANFQRVGTGERNWFEAGILDYDISVQVAFSSEKRVNNLEVRQGVVTSAESARWDEAAQSWSQFSAMREEEFRFFTVPGLLETVRSALQNENVPRTEIRLQLEEAPPIPSLIYMGEIVQDGIVMDTTSLVIEILSFEIR